MKTAFGFEAVSSYVAQAALEHLFFCHCIPSALLLYYYRHAPHLALIILYGGGDRIQGLEHVRQAINH